MITVMILLNRHCLVLTTVLMMRGNDSNWLTVITVYAKYSSTDRQWDTTCQPTSSAQKAASYFVAQYRSDCCFPVVDWGRHKMHGWIEEGKWQHKEQSELLRLRRTQTTAGTKLDDAVIKTRSKNGTLWQRCPSLI